MSPCTSCSVLPRSTILLTGVMNPSISAWKAASIPMLTVPSITRSPPMPRINAVLAGMRKRGTADSSSVCTLRRCSVPTVLAW